MSKWWVQWRLACRCGRGGCRNRFRAAM